MSDLIVHGGAPLAGTIRPSANKNAVLPILAATLLTHEPVRLERVPEITDARRMLELFRAMGSRVEADFATGVVEIEHRDTTFDARTMRLPEGMRSSILLVPPLLTRFGCARIEDEVRGCTLGVREIDPHIEVFEHFGARTERGDDGWVLNVKRPLQAVHHWLDYASVTTTENFVLCAVLAQGRSVLTNAACEPHVQEFCRFLIALGARIDGVGTSTLSVTGVPALRGGEHRFDEDFHEITTFLALSAITGGDVKVKNPVPEQFPLIDRTFAKLGAFVTHEDGWSRVVTEGGRLRV
ncbi:MAG TPA: UDP-N-acetylglucosamine 1-carboxyvinyltransferase, partial [Burkholderiaceae bacterium]